MADTRTTDEVVMLKGVLERFLEEGDLTQPSEAVNDALLGLKRLNITLDILKKTKIGQSVNNIKKKYVSQKATSDLAKDLVLKWKKVFEQSQVATSSQRAPAAPAASVAATVAVVAAAVQPPIVQPAPVRAAEATAQVAAKKDLGYMTADLSEPRKNVSIHHAP